MKSLDATKSPALLRFTGAGFLLGYILLASAKGVLVGNLVQDIDPYLLALSCFTVTAGFFFMVERRWLHAHTTLLRSLSRDIFLLNATTTLSWLAFYLALREIEPAIVSAITLGVGPVLTGLMIKRMRPESKISSTEKISALGVLLSLLYLAFVSSRGLSGVATLSPSQIALGLLFSFLTGLGVAGNTLYAKRISEHGMNASRIMAVRFPLLLIIAATAVLFRGPSLDPLLIKLPVVLSMAVFGTIVPLYLLFRGIELIEPMVVALLLCLAPVFAILFQLYDPRLQFSPASIVGVVLVITFALIGSGLTKLRKTP